MKNYSKMLKRYLWKSSLYYEWLNIFYGHYCPIRTNSDHGNPLQKSRDEFYFFSDVSQMVDEKKKSARLVKRKEIHPRLCFRCESLWTN